MLDASPSFLSVYWTAWFLRTTAWLLITNLILSGVRRWSLVIVVGSSSRTPSTFFYLVLLSVPLFLQLFNFFSLGFFLVFRYFFSLILVLRRLFLLFSCPPFEWRALSTFYCGLYRLYLQIFSYYVISYSFKFFHNSLFRLICYDWCYYSFKEFFLSKKVLKSLPAVPVFALISSSNIPYFVVIVPRYLNYPPVVAFHFASPASPTPFCLFV